MSRRAFDSQIDGAKEWGLQQWWQLELLAFARAPSVQVDLAILAPVKARKVITGRPPIINMVLALAMLVSVVLPTIAMVVMVRWIPESARQEMPDVLVGGFFLFSVLVTIFAELRGRSRPRAVPSSTLRTTALMHIGPGIVVVLLVVYALFRGDVTWDLSKLWLLPVLFDVIVHALILGRGPIRPGGPANSLENLRQSVGELTPHLREQIRNDLANAIERLRTGGQISASEAELAMLAPLGELALTMTSPQKGKKRKK